MSTAALTPPASTHSPLTPERTGSPSAVRRHVQRTGAALLNQQCWLWGCDVRREAGNGLVQRGFSRMRPPCDRDRSTQYTLAEQGFVVRLWGSGMYAGSATEGLFLNRFLFEPRCALHRPEAWQDPVLLKGGPRFWDHARLAQLCAWIAAYEAWVAGEFGPGYRRVCLACFKESVSAAEQIAAAWQGLATLLDASLQHPALPGRTQSPQATLALKPVTAITGC